MNKHVVVSVQDFTPKFHSELVEILSELDHKGINKRTIACVPNFNFKYPIYQCPKTVNLLQEEYAKGNEICMHGYSHLKKGREREFKDLPAVQARLRLMQGKKLLDMIEVKATGFVVPYWKMSEENIDTLIDMNDKLDFRFYTMNPEIYDIKTGNTYSSRPIWCWPYRKSLDYAFRAFNWYLAKVKHNDNDLIRIAIHPDDLRNSKPFEHLLTLYDSIKDETHLSSYEEYLDSTSQHTS